MAGVSRFRFQVSSVESKSRWTRGEIRWFVGGDAIYYFGRTSVLASRLVSSLAPPTVDVSCLNGQGIEALKDAIKNLVWAGKIEAGMLQVMINSRHQEALGRAREATLDTIEALRADVTLELVALDLRIAVNAVGEIVGKTATEDLLDSIFSQFCIGK